MSDSILTYKIKKKQNKKPSCFIAVLLTSRKVLIFLKEVLLLCHFEKFSYITESSEQFNNTGLKFVYHQRNCFLKMKISRILEKQSLKPVTWVQKAQALPDLAENYIFACFYKEYLCCFTCKILRNSST